MAARGKAQTRAGVIIRREQPSEAAAHHGGAWKVAYADFVTAMMAFFLLMWLINATTEEQRKGLADYFSNENVASRQYSGSGEPFGGRNPSDDGAAVSDRGTVQVIQGNKPVPPDTDDDRHRPFVAAGASEADHGDPEDGQGAGHDGHGRGGQVPAQAGQPSAVAADAAAQAAAAAAETKALEQAAQQLRDAVRADPSLAAAADVRQRLLGAERPGPRDPAEGRLGAGEDAGGRVDLRPYRRRPVSGAGPHELGAVVGARQRDAPAADRAGRGAGAVPLGGRARGSRASGRG